MTEALSVLLIIGAAVVGPIEGTTAIDSPRHISCWETHGRASKGLVYSNVGPPQSVEEYCKKYATIPAETVAQLCERVMREVGIDTSNSVFVSYGSIWKVMGDGSKRFVQAVGAWEPFRTAQDSWALRCLPVPAGYRR